MYTQKTYSILKPQRETRHEISNCGSSFRSHPLSAAIIFLWTILLVISVPVSVDAQPWWRKTFEQAEQTGRQILDGKIDEFKRQSENQQQQKKPAQQSSAAASKTPTRSTPAQHPSQSGSGAVPLNYPNLLRLYIAEHGDLLNNEAFAWHYFQIYKAPESRTQACTELRQQARNTIRFAELVDRESAAFTQEFRQFDNAPTSGVFSAPVTLQIKNYDLERKAFPVTGVYLSYNKALSPELRCNVLKSPPGPNHAPGGFSVDSVTVPSVSSVPVSREAARAMLDKSYSQLRDLPAVATVRIQPLQFVTDSSRVSLKGEVIGLTVNDPVSGKALYSFSFAGDLPAEEPIGTALSNSLMTLTNSSLMLYMIRDNPDIVTPKLARALTRRQVQSERQYWQNIDNNIDSMRRNLEAGDPVVSNLNSARPLFAYQWHLLRRSDPALAQEALEAFIRPDASWEFYRNESAYDPRLDAYVAASIFSRQSIGLPSVQTLLTADLPPVPQRAPTDLTSVDFLLPELTPVISDFLQQVSQAMPIRLKLDFGLNAKFDAAGGILLLGDQYSDFSDAKPVKPLKTKQRVSFAADGADFGSAINLPLPQSAQDRFLYQLGTLTEPQETRPGLYKSAATATDAWRSLLRAGMGSGDTSIGRVATLALNREVAFSPVSVSREVVERAQGKRYRNSYSFPVTGRLIVDVERLDIAKLQGSLSSGQKRQINNGALLARVAGLELIDQNGTLIHSFDVDRLTAASDVAQAKRAAEARANASEDAARDRQVQKQTARRAGLQMADVIGIRLGMPVAEAGRLIREHMNVGWVAELKADAPGVRSANRPYNYFKTYVSANGSEHVALYWHPEISDKLLAVTRTLILPEDSSDKAVLTQLKDKYGTDALALDPSSTSWVWTVDYGTTDRLRHVSNPTNEQRFRRGPCQASVRQAFRIRSLDIIEGESITFDIQRRLPSGAGTATIDVYGGRSGTTLQTQWDSAGWSECGPTVSAKIKSNNLGKTLVIGMHDLSTYAPVYNELLMKDAEDKGSGLTL